MAVIPRFTSRARAPGPTPGVTAPEIATGRGLQKVGQAVSNLGVVLFERQKELNRQKNQVELAKFDADLQTKRTELLLAAQDQGEADGLTERLMKEYNDFIEDRSRGIRELPDIGNKVSLYAESHRSAFEPRVLEIENKRLEGAVRDGLTDSLSSLEISAFRDPSAVESIRDRGNQAIEGTAAAAGIAPEALPDEQEKWGRTVYTAAVRGFIAKNPVQTLAELEAGKYDPVIGDVETLRTLTKEAEQATRVQEAERRRANQAAHNRLKSHMRDDLASLEASGVGMPNIEAQAAALLEPDEYDEFLTQRELAKEQHARFKEMEFASTEDIVSILNASAPEPGAVGFADEYQNFQQSQAAAAKIFRERSSDSAGYAMKAPEIAEGFRLAQEQESPQLFQQAIGARLRFQEEMGADPRVLSDAQANNIAARINEAPATERPGLMAGLRETYGLYFDMAMKELAADKKVDGLTALLPDYAGDPVVGQRLAGAIEIGDKELKQGLSSIEIKDMNAAIDEGLMPFQQAFEAVPTSSARRMMNDLREAAKLYALSVFRQTGDASGAGEQAIQDLIGKNFEILDTSRISAYMPRFIGNEALDPGAVEDAAESLITRERIKAFNPDPVTMGFEGENMDIARERTISTAANSGVWITNSTADGLVLMLPLTDGGMIPLVNEAGAMFEMKFVDAGRIKMSLPPPRAPESDIRTGREQGVRIEEGRFEDMRQRARESLKQ